MIFLSFRAFCWPCCFFNFLTFLMGLFVLRSEAFLVVLTNNLQAVQEWGRVGSGFTCGFSLIFYLFFCQLWEIKKSFFLC
jgi:hypothetical protein